MQNLAMLTLFSLLVIPCQSLREDLGKQVGKTVATGIRPFH